MFDITGSPAALGTVYFFSYIPQLLFSQFGGVFADRYDRRLLMTMQLLGAVGALAIGLLADTGTATLVNVSIASFAVGTCQTLQAPAAHALMPALWRHHVRMDGPVPPPADAPGATGIGG